MVICSLLHHAHSSSLRAQVLLYASRYVFAPLVSACISCSNIIYLSAITDISHSPSQNHSDLRDRGETSILVYNPDNVQPCDDDKEKCELMEMHPFIQTYKEVYGEDLASRIGISNTKLPAALAVSTLLNPTFGRQPLIVGSGLMSEEQYTCARSSLLQMMQDILDSKDPLQGAMSSDDSEDSRDGSLPSVLNNNHKKAEHELRLFENHKKAKYLPDLKEDGRHITLGDNPDRYLIVGKVVQERGDDLPSKKNLADYLDNNGRCDVLLFFDDHKQIFPTLFLVAQCMASRRVTEVGCERFFSISGYVSDPRRTRLGVRTYERLAMLSANLQHVYIDPKQVAKEYLRRCKEGLWKKANLEEAATCWNLERLIQAEMLNKPKPDHLSINDLLKSEKQAQSEDKAKEKAKEKAKDSPIVLDSD